MFIVSCEDPTSIKDIDPDFLIFRAMKAQV